jgi:hypothetical protein
VGQQQREKWLLGESLAAFVGEVNLWGFVVQGDWQASIKTWHNQSQAWEFNQEWDQTRSITGKNQVRLK